jgi:N-acyl-D-aspartate/D-glutamate deacylase
MGSDYRRPATRGEVDSMRVLVRRGLAEGAWGLSAGLEYVPGRWSTTDEVVALVKETVPQQGVYIAHERSEGADPMWYWPSQHEGRPPSLVDAVRETIEIGERTGATVVASHIKAKGAHYWGASRVVIRLIDEARRRGVSVYADQYPYNTTGSDGSTVLIPRWVFSRERAGEPEDYAAALRDALSVDSLASMVRLDVAHEIRRRGGPQHVVVMEYPIADWVGQTVGDLAATRGVSAVDMAIVLQLEGDPRQAGGGALRGFSLSEYDIEPYAKQEWTATATDGWISLPEDGLTHARVYGTFPRKIRRYAIERELMTIEQAVRSSTSLPAAIMGFADRGALVEGHAADIVVFDPESIADNATFFDPHRYPSGMEYVLVNGRFVVDGGEPTWALPGRVLTHEGSLGR